VIFVDTNVFVYAVGRAHPLREEAQRFFVESAAAREHLVTSAEVLQELLHIYIGVGRSETLRNALQLATSVTREIWNLEPEDVLLAATLASQHEHLGSRDLVHLACCTRRQVRQVRTFDRALHAAFKGRA
jgi:predicted nucleic acid-binding protein